MDATKCKVVVEHTPAEAALQSAEMIAGAIQETAAAGRMYNIALCGGTTPGEMYRQLASPRLAERIPWDRVGVFFGDERDVPQDHVESNYRLVAQCLLDQVPIPLSQVHPMPADARDLATAARQYEDLIRRLVPAEERLPRFDLILLGMGVDGHTASLFPNTPALDEQQRLVAAQFVPVIGRNRMTFTFPLINAARHVMFLVTGADKAEVVSAVMGDDPQAKAHYPAARVNPRNGDVTFVLDAAAARDVTRGQ